MPQFVKKPGQVRAKKWDGDPVEAVKLGLCKCGPVGHAHHVHLPGTGVAYADPGYWIIQDEHGSLPMSPAEFDRKYQRVPCNALSGDCGGTCSACA